MGAVAQDPVKVAPHVYEAKAWKSAYGKIRQVRQYGGVES